MSKRLEKRYKRQVSRAKGRVKLSEADVRTPEQMRAARAASQPPGGWRGGPHVHYLGNSTPAAGGAVADRNAKAGG